MLAARGEEEGGAFMMSDRQVRDELMTVLVAGQETSAIALAWCVALLAHHPAAGSAAAAAVDGLLGPPGAARAPAPADVGRLPYLEAVLLEALRLLPPAYIVGRCAAAGAGAFGPAGRFSLPPGTTALVSPWLLHRAPSAWDRPREFWPERWLPLLEEGPPSPGPGGLRCGPALAGLGPNGAFCPFGAGPRVCIGASFAMMEGVLVLAAAVSAVRFEPAERGAAFPMAAARITLRPESVRVRLVQR
jgi:cytochrome P450